MNRPEFTGERFIPGQGGAQIAYEHLHRYLFATRLAAGKRVLDVATGTGYGAALLSRAASLVVAMDLDAAALGYARETHGSSIAGFVRADALALPVAGASFDLVVVLELLEHLAEGEELIREAARVVRPEGLVLVSTPDKKTYTDARDYRNPFHVREFYREEFLDLLRAHFDHVRLLRQQVRAGSLLILDEEASEVAEVFTRPPADPEAAITAPMYFLAVCGHQPVEEIRLSASAYMDPSDYLLREWEARLRESGREIARLNEEIRALGEWGRELKQEVDLRLEEVHARDETIRSLQDEMREAIASRDGVIRSVQGDLDERTRWARAMEQEVADRDRRLETTQRELERLAGHWARVRRAGLYRILCRLGLLPD